MRYSVSLAVAVVFLLLSTISCQPGKHKDNKEGGDWDNDNKQNRNRGSTTVSPPPTDKTTTKAANSIEDLWNQFLEKFKLDPKKNQTKSLTGAKKVAFVKSVNRVNTQQQAYKSGQSKYQMETNKFADLTDDERKSYLGIPPVPKKSTVKSTKTTTVNVSSIRKANRRFRVPPILSLKPKTKVDVPRKGAKVVKITNGLPESIDYRDTGFVSNIKDQQSCGSCWSFSTTGALEGQMPQLRSLAEQQLVDCGTMDAPYGGCDGAWPQHTMEWMKENSISLGLQTSYPYLAKKNVCATSNTVGVKIKEIGIVPAKDETALMAAVANKGPVSVTLNADDLYLYKDGIYDNPSCSKSVNHAVLAVGYGSENGVDFWTIKNSWGEDWGETGFMRLKRGSNMCGIVSEDSVYASIEQDDNSKLECVDQSPYCMTWALSGYCSVSQVYMEEKCKASCKKCRYPRIYIRSCTDKNPQCDEWAKNGDCKQYWQYMLYNCPKACSVCTKWIGYYPYPQWLLDAAGFVFS